MFDLNKLEFAAAVKNLQNAVQYLRKAAEAESVNMQKLNKFMTRVQQAKEEVETHRSNKSIEKSDPLDYSTAIPVLAEAEELLLAADDVDPGIPLLPERRPESKPINLPKLKLPTFDGNITKFPKFMNTVQTILEQYDIPSQEKLLHLEAALVGEPARLLENLPVNQQTYDIALQKLKTKYDQQDQVVTALYEKIRSIPAAKEETKSLRITLDELENSLQALEL